MSFSILNFRQSSNLIIFRHSHFGGTYVVQNMKAIGENQLLCHKPYQKIEALDFGQDKVIIASASTKRIGLSISLFSLSLFLSKWRK